MAEQGSLKYHIDTSIDMVREYYSKDHGFSRRYVLSTLQAIKRQLDKLSKIPLVMLSVTKVENTPNYGAVYTVSLPTRFFFNKDGSFDGYEFCIENATEFELVLIKDLLDKLDLKPVGKREI